MRIKPFLAGVLGLYASLSSAQTSGEYITAGGWGHLVIRERGGGMSDFQIATTGANGHTCNLEGSLRSGIGWTATFGLGEPRCVIAVTGTESGILVTPHTFEGCRGFCGMRAGFDGEYLPVGPECADAARQKARTDAAADALATNHQHAATLLQNLLSQCTLTLSGIESAEMYNDLAVAYRHLGRHSDCLDTLKPVLAATPQSDLDAMRNTVPGDYEQWLAIAQKARLNERLCSQPPSD